VKIRNSRVSPAKLSPAPAWVVIAGEITTKGLRKTFKIWFAGVVQSIGYDNAVYGFDSNTCRGDFQHQQNSPADIAMGVDTGCAGDQGMMFGFALQRNPRTDAPPDFSWQHKTHLKNFQKFRKKWGTCPLLAPPTANRKSRSNTNANHKVKRRRCRGRLHSAFLKAVGNDELRAEHPEACPSRALIPAHLLDEDTK